MAIHEPTSWKGGIEHCSVEVQAVVAGTPWEVLCKGMGSKAIFRAAHGTQKVGYEFWDVVIYEYEKMWKATNC